MFFFRKKNKPDSYALVQEKWKTGFGFWDKNRFEVQKEDTYESGTDKNRFFLKLKKKNHFAWVLSELYRYKDFHMEADIEFDEENPYSASGFILRYINDENFYYFLISNRGRFRFDLVFNGNPMKRIDWTESPLITNKLNSVRIIARDTFFSFYIDDEWIAEVEDDILFEGRIGFAAQNYNESPEALFYLNNFLIESRPIEVEKHFERWTAHIPQEPEARIRLAKTLYTMGAFPAATIQLKKALRHKKPDADDFFLFCEMCVNMGMYDLALETAEKCLALEPSRKEVIQEKGNILYLLNRFLDARDYIKENISGFEDNATIWNLLGNCEYSLGNFQKSQEAYETAISIQDSMPIFFRNAARAAEMNGDKKKALDYFVKSSRLFFREEAYNELYPVFNSVRKIDPDNNDVRVLEGMILFLEKKYSRAEEIFKKLIEQGYRDSSIFYINGIIKMEQGNRERAIEDFTKACELEDSFYLYWLRLGETKLLIGQDPEFELKKALDLSPDDPWALNQYGLYLLQKGDDKTAGDYFTRALEKLPDEADIAINLSQSVYNLGQRGMAFTLLETEAFQNNPKINNHRGNLYTRERDYQRAVHQYEKALNLDPGNPAYLENCAKACIEADMIMHAEGHLTKLFDISPTAPVYNLIGYLALIQRDWIRAGVAFRQGLELDPENGDIMVNMASLYLDRSEYEQAKEWVEKALRKNPENTDALQIKERIRLKFEIKFECATCRRHWWAPRNVSAQSPIRIHGEPPGDAPAGKCETCGKIYCIECAQKYLKDKRFVCPDCNQFLKLSDDWLKYLLLERIKNMDK
ncbi:MAG: tetratricopeptide repeat protein [Spirochaetales bacterium]|nr:tetratricopeptide repeat protein [Spirochaetales bacterium]